MKLKLAFIALTFCAGAAMAQPTAGAAPQAGATGSDAAKVSAEKLFKAQADARFGAAGAGGKAGPRPAPEPSKLSFKERKDLLTSAAQKHLTISTKAQKCFAAAKDDNGLRECFRAQMTDTREAFPRELRHALDTEARHLLSGQGPAAGAAQTAATPAPAPKTAEQKK